VFEKIRKWGKSMLRIFMLASSILAVSILPSTAQTVTGKVSATVDNTFGSSIGLNLQQCTGCSYSTSPPSSVANNTTSPAYVFSATTPGTGGLSTTRYSHTIGTQPYTCQFQASNSYSTGGGACATPSVSANASAGVFPAPGCKILSQSAIDPTTCNYTVKFGMTPTN
jgi:hypothetical protein